jgi:TolB-like protein
MEAFSAGNIFLFERFRLDRRGLFLRDENGAHGPVEIGSRALDVLRVLLARPGDLLSRDEIMAAAWPGTVVEDNNLTIQISTLRRVLDQDVGNGSCIQTIPGRGYRFVSLVARVDGDARSAVQIVPRGGERLGSRVSIVVLPFTNLSEDRERQYFADGITEDLTTDLSRLENMVVISRNTAFTYRDKRVHTKQIGYELGVRYVLQGSVQRWCNQVRVTAQLIDAESDAHLWAERFDRDIGDLFALQNEITGRIANALNIELVAAEAARPTDNLDALDYIFRGRAAGLKPNSRDIYVARIGMFEHALALDPRSVEALTLLAEALAGGVLDGMTDSEAADIERAERLVDRALSASPRYAPAHAAKGVILHAQGRSEEAIPEFETVLAINRNAVGVLDVLAGCKLVTGSIEEVIPLEEQAIRLSPRDPRIGYFYLRIGHVHLLQSRPDEAILWLEIARSAVPKSPFVHVLLASAHGLKGDIERAAAELAKARGLTATNRWSSIAHVKAYSGGYGGAVPKIRALFEATYLAGLRKAGMAEE